MQKASKMGIYWRLDWRFDFKKKTSKNKSLNHYIENPLAVLLAVESAVAQALAGIGSKRAWRPWIRAQCAPQTGAPHVAGQGNRI
ncbi:MAG: hypothetical protein PHI55_15810 [Burkholderiaceae bacterium]|nr:hypothetical protein [Burkholderiaceae bacterium]